MSSPCFPKSNAQVIESTTLSPRLAQLTRNFQIGFVGFYCLRMLSSSEISIAEVAEQRTLSSSVFRAAEHGKADRKSTRLNSSQEYYSYAFYCVNKKGE